MNTYSQYDGVDSFTYAVVQRSYPLGHLVPHLKFVQNLTPSGSLLAFVQPITVEKGKLI
jgi:hypothetical protein